MSAASCNSDPPGRLLVFAEIWYRSFALAVAGGFVIGGVALPIVVQSDGFEFSLVGTLVGLMLGAVIGAAVGILLGMVAGGVVGAVGAVCLVPYRGRRSTRLTLRTAAAATVGLWFPVFVPHDVYDTYTTLAVVAILVPSVVVAWWVGPWVGNWYLAEMEPHDQSAVPAPLRSM